VDRKVLTLAVLTGLFGISCCVAPTVLALIGFASVSFVISLGHTLYSTYGWYFRGTAVLLAVVGVVMQTRGPSTTAMPPGPHSWSDRRA
jgi:hypothetical protein